MSLSRKNNEEVLYFLSGIAKKNTKIEKIILFGSRSRGDHKERSDFDIAILAPQMSDQEWAQIALLLRESAPTLCGIDVIRLNDTISENLQKKIRTEGQTIYERK